MPRDEHFFGAGIAFVDPLRRRVFLLLRAPGLTYANCWNTPGGTREPGEHIYQTAVRETLEEIGFMPDHYMRVMVPIYAGRGAYALFIATVTPEVASLLGSQTRLQKKESSAWGWADLNNPPDNLVPGLKKAWPKLRSML